MGSGLQGAPTRGGGKATLCPVIGMGLCAWWREGEFRAGLSYASSLLFFFFLSFLDFFLSSMYFFFFFFTVL